MQPSEARTRSAAQWATDVGLLAARLPSEAARAAFLAKQCRQIMEEARGSGMSEHDTLILAQSCVDGAERIMRELLARGTSMPGGRA